MALLILGNRGFRGSLLAGAVLAVAVVALTACGNDQAQGSTISGGGSGGAGGSGVGGLCLNPPCNGQGLCLQPNCQSGTVRIAGTVGGECIADCGARHASAWI